MKPSTDKDCIGKQVCRQGEISGKYDAIHSETTNLHVRSDGTSDWETRGFDITNEGEMVLRSGKGTGRRESQTSRFEGEAPLKTSSKRLDWLNSTKFWIEGTQDIARGKATVKIYVKE